MDDILIIMNYYSIIYKKKIMFLVVKIGFFEILDIVYMIYIYKIF